MSEFRRELTNLINKHSKENGSNTPDWMLAEFLMDCLSAFDKTTVKRDAWWGHKHEDEHGNFQIGRDE